MITTTTDRALTRANDMPNVIHHVTRSLSKASRRVYISTYRDWATYAQSRGGQWHDLAPANIQAYLDTLSSSAGKRARLAHLRKLLRVLALVSPLHQRYYDASNELIHIDPNEATAPPAPPRCLTIDEVRALLQTFPGNDPIDTRNRAVIQLLLFTGIRRSELAKALWSHINWQDSTLFIPVRKRGKSGFAAILNPTLVQPTLRTLKSDAAATDNSPIITASKNGFLTEKALSPERIWAIAAKAAKQAGIAHFSPHALRRTHLTLLSRAGASISDMQAQAGHADPSTTMLYIRALQPAQLAQTINLLDQPR